MKIGELLLAKSLIDRPTLARALRDQPATEQRLCSLLIARKVLDPDDAARALAEQHGLAGVLQRHLSGRDTEVANRRRRDLAGRARAHSALGGAFTRILLEAKKS